MKNWKTTLIGLVASVLSGGQDLAALLTGNTVDWKKLGLALAFLVWGYFQKDKNVTGV